jgi:hypothetical protein
METREDRGRVITSSKKLQRRGDGPYWLVPSQMGNSKYLVDEERRTCTCPDWEDRREPCKHVFAVEYTIELIRCEPETGTSISQTLRVTYRQDWPVYNAAQTHEKERVALLLRDLCAGIDNGVQGRGRPRLPLSDGVFSAVMKVYGTTSGRRAQDRPARVRSQGYIAKAPHYNSVFNVLGNPAVMPLLTKMIEESARPLKAVGTDFAIDASGFPTSTYARWYSAKYGRMMAQNKWLKAHVVIGTLTNVVCTAEITDGYPNDAPQFVDLVERAAETFDIKRLSADKAYSNRIAHFTAERVGAQAFIPFKTNSRPGDGDLWTRMWRYFMFNREEFWHHYHRRSNVETTFSMVKAKFGTKIRSKTDAAQVNEILCKLICHNLVHATYELGIEATFWKGAA